MLDKAGRSCGVALMYETCVRLHEVEGPASPSMSHIPDFWGCASMHAFCPVSMPLPPPPPPYWSVSSSPPPPLPPCAESGPPCLPYEELSGCRADHVSALPDPAMACWPPFGAPLSSDSPATLLSADPPVGPSADPPFSPPPPPPPSAWLAGGQGAPPSGSAALSGSAAAAAAVPPSAASEETGGLSEEALQFRTNIARGGMWGD